MAERTSPARLKPRPPIVERASPARLAQLVIVVGLALAIPAPAAAHDVENTHVLITFTSEGTYQIDILNDADWLWLQLAPQTKALPPVAERDRQLSALTGKFTQEIRLTFDDQPVEAGSVEYVPPLDTAPLDEMGWHEPGMMRLGGRVPEGASAFRFAYRLIEDPYPLTILPPQGEAVTRWLMTGEVSETFEIAALRPLTRLQVSVQYLPRARLHAHPAQRPGPHPVHRRTVPAQHQAEAAALAGHGFHRRAHHHPRAGDLRVVSLSPAIVEPLIALSIAYVAVENLVTTELKPWRVGLVFAFGLLHGMGFAGVLADLGLPRSELVTFNAGVELGQLSVVGIAFVGVVGVVDRDWYRQRVVVPVSTAIAAVGLFWTIQRVLSA